MAKLNPKQQRFVEEYLVDLNATQAAIRAGYSQKTAGAKGFELLKIIEIQKAIAEAMGKREKRTNVTQDRVVKELARIAFADPRRVMKWGPRGVMVRPSDEVSDDDAAIVAEAVENMMSVRLKTHDKLKALELLGKHLGMFTEKVEHSGSIAARGLTINLSGHDAKR